MQNLKQGNVKLTPVFVHGLELYLSEPVNCDDKLLASLFQLWSQLQLIESFRRIAGPTTKFPKELIPELVRLTEEVLPAANEACQKIDAVMKKMKPLE